MGAAQNAEEQAGGQASRRSAARFGVDGEAQLVLLKHGSTLACRVVDISLSGCRMRTEARYAARSAERVEVAFKVRGFAFRFSGITQWSDEQHLVGIRFQDVPMRRREELIEALSEVEAELAAKAAKEAAMAAETQRKAAEEAERAAAQPVVAPAPVLAQAKPTSRERRVALRAELDTTAVIHLINIGSHLRGRIHDLSLSGCRVHTDERFPVGIYTRVEVEFYLDGLPFRLGGVVQAIHDRQTVGIRFVDMSARRREQVEQLMEEMQGRE